MRQSCKRHNLRDFIGNQEERKTKNNVFKQHHRLNENGSGKSLRVTGNGVEWKRIVYSAVSPQSDDD